MPAISSATTTATPYADAAADYRAAGWSDVLPLPPGRKGPPPVGFTGADGRTPTDEDVARWVEERPDSNVALRLPSGVVGIDVDDYGDKRGGATLAALEARLGELPATVMTSARTSGVSGIRLVRAPEGLTWRREAGEHIDVVHRAHRMAVAGPSLHPDGGTYAWVSSVDRSPATLPRPEELPELPAAWVEHLSAGTEADRVSVDEAEVEALLAELEVGDADEKVAAVLRDFDLGSGDRHGAMLRTTLRLVAAGAGGAVGVPGALAMVREAYLAEKPGRETERDYRRALRGAVERVVSDRRGLGFGPERAEPLPVLPPRPRTSTEDGEEAGAGRRAAVSANDVFEFITRTNHLGVSQEGMPFAASSTPGEPRVAQEIKPMRGAVLRRYREETAAAGRPVIIGPQALTSALEAVEAEALAREPEHVALRVHTAPGTVTVDLGDAAGRVVEVTAAGWRVLDPSPSTPLFRRSAATRALPVPEAGGSLDVLRGLLGLEDDEARWKLARGWLAAALLDDVPRPLFWATGVQGSGKSTRARMLLSVVEPNDALGKAPGRRERDDTVAANGRFLVSYDNITSVSAATSDWVCRLVTGVTEDSRTLYSNETLRLVTYRRSGVATSINMPAGLGSDALERLVHVDFERVPDSERRSEAELWGAFDAARASILGAVLDDVARILAHREQAARARSSWPRMADYGQALAALDLALGLDLDAGHLAAYTSNVDVDLAERAQDDPFSAAVIAVAVHAGGTWKGTVGELDRALKARLGIERPRWWPENARAVGSALDRASEALRHAGITVEKGRRSAQGKTVTLTASPAAMDSLDTSAAASTPF
ncbi:bifunctional DNA primase/polymerase [uncultured Pseudokineococcus sp.]|uniref:bifunctional DNA primase/polymerase n=1 Tax=uncultured Pseudokineococcus sp. TaxID=1642928 RepID=UPI002619FD72|nr:bifunctional DNA primase/polymerase [uncultured Pseudokineococcus sp.]